MLQRIDHVQLLRYAGLFTWACTGIPLLAEGFQVGLTGAEIMGWRVAYLLFGLTFFAVTRSLPHRGHAAGDVVIALTMTAAAIAVSHYSGSGLGGSLLLITAGVLPWLLPQAFAWAWLVLQYLALVPIFAIRPEFGIVEALLQGVLFLGFSSFVFVVSLVARQQSEARTEQRRLIAELRSTRALLAESTRLNERMRISRELHDLLGHHLTALSLNLEVASHLTEGSARKHVQQSQALAKLLLTDVREAVSQLRDDDAVDLIEALRLLAGSVPSIRIDLDLPPVLRFEDPARAHVLLRCAQEILTNAARHAKASELRIAVVDGGDRVRLAARDDGVGAADGFTPGNGLRGMRERLSEFGGTLTISTGVGEGFGLDLELPKAAPFSTFAAGASP